ncbi:MAG: hypothetical protein Q4B58_07810 [Bacteroidales bacterium]|nr:hypothetical protein [Bacteroidales bacterium]
MIIGLDLGISATKIVLLDSTKASCLEIWEGGFRPEKLEAYIQNNIPKGAKLECIAVTGVGSIASAQISGHKIKTVDEFKANAKAAEYVCHAERFIVASIGTATSFVKVDQGAAKHIGGSALGGGALMTLFQMIMQGGGWQHLRMLAERGNLNNVDTTIGDVCMTELPDLPTDASAVNLGRLKMSSTPDDIVLGLVNMVLQNIGVMTHLAGKGYGITEFVLLGRTVTLPHANEIFERLENLYGIHIIVPKHPEFMTAIGAALSV